MLNIKRSSRISNSEIYERIGMDPLTNIIQHRQLKYVGHCLMKDKEKKLITKCVLYEPRASHGKRKQDKSNMTYAEYIGKLFNLEIPPSADNRLEWKSKFVDACRPRVFKSTDDDAFIY